jgi:hypothetical protein
LAQLAEFSQIAAEVKGACRGRFRKVGENGLREAGEAPLK